MRTKRSSLAPILFILAIAVGAHLGLRETERPSPSELNRPSDHEEAPASAPPPPVVSPAPARATGFRKLGDPAAGQPKPRPPVTHSSSYAEESRAAAAAGLVEFEVVPDSEGGLAVAFGDVILGRVEEGSTTRRGHHEVPPLSFWDKPEIPYSFHPDLPDRARVERALEYFGQHTPVSFVPRTHQTDAIVFEPGPEHCYSALGRTGGLQPIRLSPKCQTQEILHELMHALGFVHEQSRPDRDASVEVVWDAIDSKFRPQFAIVPDALTEASRGTAFDFKSVMLYRPGAFAARSGAITLKPQPGRPAIDPVAQGLSEGDLQRLKRMYRQ